MDNGNVNTGTAIGLNITHNASFYAESVNVAACMEQSEVG